MSHGRCGRCPATVTYAVTEAGKRQALNPDIDGTGSVVAYTDGAGTLRCRVPSPSRPMQPWERRYMPHAATCTPAVPPAPAVMPDNVISFATAKARRRGRIPPGRPTP